MASKSSLKLALEIKAKDEASPAVEKAKNSLEKYARTLKDAKFAADRFASAGERMSRIFRSFGIAFAAIGASGYAAYRAFVKPREEMIRLDAAIKGATGTIDDLVQRKAFLLNLANETGASFAELAKSFAFAQQTGLAPMSGTLKAILDTTVAATGSASQLNDVSRQFAQMVAKGKITQEDLMPLLERGILIHEGIAIALDRSRESTLAMAPELAGVNGTVEEMTSQLQKMQDKLGKGAIFASVLGLGLKNAGQSAINLATVSGQFELLKTRLMFLFGGEDNPVFQSFMGAIKRVIVLFDANKTRFQSIAKRMADSIGSIIDRITKPENLERIVVAFTSLADIALKLAPHVDKIAYLFLSMQAVNAALAVTNIALGVKSLALAFGALPASTLAMMPMVGAVGLLAVSFAAVAMNFDNFAKAWRTFATDTSGMSMLAKIGEALDDIITFARYLFPGSDDQLLQERYKRKQTRLGTPVLSDQAIKQRAQDTAAANLQSRFSGSMRIELDRGLKATNMSFDPLMSVDVGAQ